MIALALLSSDNFKPPPVESSRPGVLSGTPSATASTSTLVGDESNFRLELPSSAAGEDDDESERRVQVFTGVQSVGKDVDCLLIWDDETEVGGSIIRCSIITYDSLCSHSRWNRWRHL